MTGQTRIPDLRRSRKTARWQQLIGTVHPLLLSSIAGLLTVAQVVLALTLGRPGPDALAWAGWICLWTAGVFGTLPIISFRRKGNVPDGESYVKTTVLVDTGIYAVVRHPQGGTAWLLINLGLMLLARHWTNLVLGLNSMALVYADTFKADRQCIDKFGAAYSQYIENVPRVNPLVGIARIVPRALEGE